jgi:hypothetical protein
VGLPGIVLGAISVSLSATTYWAFTVHANGLRLPPVTVNPLLNGGADTEVSARAFSTSRSSENAHHTFERQVTVRTGGFRTSSPRDKATDDEGAVVRDHSSPVPATPGAGDERSLSSLYGTGADNASQK